MVMKSEVYEIDKNIPNGEKVEYERRINSLLRGDGVFRGEDKSWFKGKLFIFLTWLERVEDKEEKKETVNDLEF